VFGAVWTYDGHALLAIARAALCFVDLPPRGPVDLVDNPPNDVVRVTGA
jgi:hypothetical protein